MGLYYEICLLDLNMTECVGIKVSITNLKINLGLSWAKFSKSSHLHIWKLVRQIDRMNNMLHVIMIVPKIPKWPLRTRVIRYLVLHKMWLCIGKCWYTISVTVVFINASCIMTFFTRCVVYNIVDVNQSLEQIQLWIDSFLSNILLFLLLSLCSNICTCVGLVF